MSPSGQVVHRYQDIISIFNACFAKEYQTRLVRGGDEPIYLPASGSRAYHAIYFAHGFFSSALHECSHWLIAGAARRQQEDFGYWYVPDGRTAAEQELFLSVEVKPQAMEWILSTAARYPFRISVDNLNGASCDFAPFQQAIYHQVKKYCQEGLSARAKLFREAICHFYGTDCDLKMHDFDFEMIG
jgi:elongation factor P hydroxylase